MTHKIVKPAPYENYEMNRCYSFMRALFSIEPPDMSNHEGGLHWSENGHNCPEFPRPLYCAIRKHENYGLSSLVLSLHFLLIKSIEPYQAL